LSALWSIPARRPSRRAGNCVLFSVSEMILGITGGIATGKSAVLKALAHHGFQTISSDDLAHQCIARNGPVYRAVVRAFGPGILTPNRQIDRKSLGAIVFGNPLLRKNLERIVHPCVVARLREFVRRHRGKFLALDIPLLYEARLQKLVDRVVVVYSTRAQQVQRLRQRNRLSRAQALIRIEAQIPLAFKCLRADDVIRNTRDLRYLKTQVDLFLSRLKKA